MKTNFMALKIFSYLGSQQPNQLILLAILSTTFSYLAFNLCQTQEQLQTITHCIELLSFLACSIILSNSLFISFIVVYSFSQYITQTLISMLPNHYQAGYLSFVLLAFSYYLVDWTKKNYPSEVEYYERKYLTGLGSSRNENRNKINGFYQPISADNQQSDESHSTLNLMLYTLAASVLTIAYQCFMIHFIGYYVFGYKQEGLESGNSINMLLLSKYSCLAFGSYFGYVLNQKMMNPQSKQTSTTTYANYNYGNFTFSQRQDNIIFEAFAYFGMIALVLLALYSVVMLPNNLVAINSCYYLVGFGINKFKPNQCLQDEQEEIDSMYYYKLI
eukprot:403376742